MYAYDTSKELKRNVIVFVIYFVEGEADLWGEPCEPGTTEFVLDFDLIAHLPNISVTSLAIDQWFFQYKN